MDGTEGKTIGVRPPERPIRYTFVLLPAFTLISFASSVEPLRIANRMAGQTLYNWRLASDGGGPVTSSAGIEVPVNGDLDEVGHDDRVLLCAGLRVKEAASRRLLGWIRREARKGPMIGALCTGAWTLADAGLLDGRRATIHWENQDSFAEQFPDIELTKSVFVLDDRRMTAAGGTAAVDMMLAVIAQDYGEPLATAVADQMVHNSIRAENDEQRLSVPTRIGTRHPRLSAVIQRMEQNLEEPISPATLAREVGMSTRQLERLFRRYVQRSPKRYYMELRLQKARNLLMQTGMSVIEVALACGFASPSHFSKCYRAHYGSTPYRERGTTGLRRDIAAG